MANRIDLYCAARTHQTWSPGTAVTAYEDRPAYCPTGQGEGHEWQEAGTTSLIELKRRLGSADPAPVHRSNSL